MTDCGCDVEKIPEKYYERYEKDFKQGDVKDLDAAKTLHYQRRYLNDYFLETEFCRRSSFALRKIVKNEFSSNEAYVAKILIYMNKAVDENPEIFKDISQVKHAAMPKAKGLNSYLEKFYSDIKDKGRWM